MSGTSSKRDGAKITEDRIRRLFFMYGVIQQSGPLTRGQLMELLEKTRALPECEASQDVEPDALPASEGGHSTRSVAYDLKMLLQLGVIVVDKKQYSPAFPGRLIDSPHLEVLRQYLFEMKTSFNDLRPSQLLKELGFHHVETLKLNQSELGQSQNDDSPPSKSPRNSSNLSHEITVRPLAINHYEPQHFHWLSLLHRGIQKNIILKCHYQGIQADSNRDSDSNLDSSPQRLFHIHPARLVYSVRDWYLIAKDLETKAFRSFRVTRIQDIQETGNHFTEDYTAQIDDLLATTWGMDLTGEVQKVVLKFSAAVAPYLEESTARHGAQTVETLPSGEVLYTLAIRGTWELKHWILSWGRSVEVLSPESLRLQVQEEALAMAKQYS
jgi:hypothetical protein